MKFADKLTQKYGRADVKAASAMDAAKRLIQDANDALGKLADFVWNNQKDLDDAFGGKGAYKFTSELRELRKNFEDLV